MAALHLKIPASSHDVRVLPALKDGASELTKEGSELFDCIPNRRCTSNEDQRRRWPLGGSARPREKDSLGSLLFVLKDEEY